MGYTTDFRGSFSLEPLLSPEQVEYINAFNRTRRMQRNSTKAEALPDKRRIAVGLPIGHQGGYYVGSVDDGDFGQGDDGSVLDHNGPPNGQPGLWCQWETDGTSLYWDGDEKFYNYVEWLRYLIEHFFKPWGIKLDGTIEWVGEDTFDDRGKIIIEHGWVVSVEEG